MHTPDLHASDRPFAVDAAHPSHAQCEVGDSTVIALDTEAAVTQFTPTWTAPTGGPRVAFAFGLPSADAVDELYAELVAAGFAGPVTPLAFVGAGSGFSVESCPMIRPGSVIQCRVGGAL